MGQGFHSNPKKKRKEKDAACLSGEGKKRQAL